MCFNKPTADDKAEKRKTTLLLAPLALLEQWKEEIETKTEKGRFRCLIYHGDKKHKSLRELQSYDVIITTFNSLAVSFCIS